LAIGKLGNLEISELGIVFIGISDWVIWEFSNYEIWKNLNNKSAKIKTFD
jgi:hypothetical protein